MKKRKTKKEKKKKNAFRRILDQQIIIAAVMVLAPIIIGGIIPFLVRAKLIPMVIVNPDFAYAYMSYGATMFLGLVVFLQGYETRHADSTRKDADYKCPFLVVTISEPSVVKQICANLLVSNVGDGTANNVAFCFRQDQKEMRSINGKVWLTNESVSVPIPLSEIDCSKPLVFEITYENLIGYKYRQKIQLFMRKLDGVSAESVGYCIDICELGRQERIGRD